VSTRERGVMITRANRFDAPVVWP